VYISSNKLSVFYSVSGLAHKLEMGNHVSVAEYENMITEDNKSTEETNEQFITEQSRDNKSTSEQLKKECDELGHKLEQRELSIKNRIIIEETNE
jgi:hypothetical protein